jgi:hypothetical protein
MFDPKLDDDQEPSTRILDDDPWGGPDATPKSERTVLGGSEYPGGPAAPSQQIGCLKMGLMVLALILAILLVLLTPAVLFAFNMERIAFNPDTYKQALIRVDFYDQLPSLVGATLSDSIAKNPEDNRALAGLTKADMQAIATGLITKEWAQTQTESVIDQGFAWLDSDAPVLSLKVSMGDIKTELSGPQGETAAMTVINSWPPCTDSQLLAMTGAVALGATSNIPVCRPPDELMPSITPYFSEIVAEGAKSIPDTIDLAAPDGVTRPIAPADDPRPVLKIYRAVAFFSPILLVLLLMGITALVVRSARGFGMWWGIPLLIGGILSAVVAISMLPLRNFFVQSLAESGDQIESSFQQIFVGVFGYIFQTAGWWIGGESALLILGGMALIILGYLTGRDGGQQKSTLPGV